MQPLPPYDPPSPGPADPEQGDGPSARHALPGSRILEVTAATEAEGRLVLRGPGGDVELEIIVTEAGPVLRARTLRIEAEDDLTLAAARVGIEASERIDLRSGGKVRIDADGPVQSIGHAQEVRARAGNVDLVANDDVRAQGERVRLNC